jgi:hypothetical protein
MIHFRVGNKSIVMMDTDKHTSTEILMVACHHRYLVGTIVVFITGDNS